MKNITILTAADLGGILGIILIIFSFSFFSSLRHSKARYLCVMMVLFASAMLTDLAGSVMRGDPDKTLQLYLVFSLKMVLDNGLVGIFVSYMRVNLGTCHQRWRRQREALDVLLILLAVFALLNPWHKLLISVNPVTGIAETEALFPVRSISSCLILLACLYQIIRRNAGGRQNRVAMGFFCISHVLAVVSAPMVKSHGLINVASMLSMLGLYVSFYMEQNQKYFRQEMELQNTRAALVLSQIQPHFLFNSMAAVMDLCDTDPQEAKIALQELSDYLHYKLTAMSYSHLVAFEEDLDFLKCYLRLEKRRFGSRLTVAYDIGPRDFQIPLLTLQPLVENAIRHGISLRPEGGNIRVSTAEYPDHYRILVEDDGVGFDPSAEFDPERGHIGLNNVRTRLSALCGGSLKVRSTPDVGTAIEITISKEEDKP